MLDRRDRIIGALLGTAVGDALGLPREGLSRQRAQKLFGDPPLEHRLIAGRGLTSDDTEHACMTAQALLASASGDPRRFARSLAWRLRGWLLGLPGGIGWGTLRALIKLWMFFPPESSGVRSAGNGPAMRAPILGIYAADRTERLALVHASTVLTHRDPRAEQGAQLIALAAATAIAAPTPDALDVGAFFAEARALVNNEELLQALGRARELLAHAASVAEYAAASSLDRGVSGYINHTVPVVLYAWLRHRDQFREALEATITLGGDTDTTGAIIGALMGATLGATAIPASWLDRLAEWPRTITWITHLGERLAEPRGTQHPLGLFWPGLVPRNLIFLQIVLAHGFRRLLPPY